jgi:hypothetical protein
MKRIFLIFIGLLTTAILLIFFVRARNVDSGRSKSISNNSSRIETGKERKQKSIHNAIMDEDNQDVIEAQNKLLDAFHAAANDNDSKSFRIALSNLLSKRFIGDPELILAELTPYLDHENDEIRYELAKVYLWAGFQTNKVIGTLLAFVESDDSETHSKKIRKSAAKLLINYRVQEAADSLWSAYQESSDRTYLFYLSILKDERASDESLKLVELKKAKYSDLHEIFGVFKVGEAAEELKTVFKARLERYPTKNHTELAWSLYQITENQEYYDYLTEREFYLNNTFFNEPNVLAELEKTLRADDGSDLNARGNSALLSLLIRADGRKVVERYLAEVFDEKIASPIDATIRYRVAAYLDSEEVNAAARRYEEKYGNGLWLHYAKRKGWPINDLLVGYDY